jgi:hypothetical protein
MDVVCSPYILCHEDMENEKQFGGEHFEDRRRGRGRLAAVEVLCPATTTAMHFILQNLLHRDRSDLTKALQDYCTFYLGHFSTLNLDPTTVEEGPPPFIKTKEWNRITYVHIMILSSSHA